MQALTAIQLSQMEQNTTYRQILRSNILKEASYNSGVDGAGLDAAGAKTWFQKRSLAERLLDQPQASIELNYWSARSLETLRGMSLNITDASTVDDILTALSSSNHEYIAGITYTEESKRVMF